MNILVLGAYGLLGSYLCPFLKKKGHQVFRQGSSINSELSFSAYSSPSDLVEAVKKNKPDIIINLIALTNVDKCESDPELAFLINVKTVDWVPNAFEYDYIHVFKMPYQLKEKYPQLLIIGDATQHIGSDLFDFKKSAFDAIVCSGYKWLLGGFGNGFIALSDDFFLQTRLTPEDFRQKILSVV